MIGKEEALSFLEDKPVSMIWGVGKAFQKKLAADGISTIGQLQQMEETDLAKSYGAMGQRISQLSKANDTRNVSPTRKTKSISSETTFNEDISNFDDLSRTLSCLLYTSPSPRDLSTSRMPSSA